ncbi:hypothetical protein CCR75_007636 [Bremia lactucae]|uniref:Uncharacterized protein n=1 Tax=Bremia lactucae TaxID=4779 RepID=A0A976FMM4_BRELC|nr:hypothetical protein CCR75_007636 [Bremia lactucae]
MGSARLVFVLSPAKTLDLSSPRFSQCSQPRLLSHAHELIDRLQKLSQSQIKSFFGVSDSLAKLNCDRFQHFDTSESVTKPIIASATLKQAVLAFNGPAYQGLEASTLSESDLEFAQTHLRILCGLYGILRPLDLIQPYRLEMGQKLATKRGKDLYEFWGDTIVSELDALFRKQEAIDGKTGTRVLINVASQEYFKSLPSVALQTANISVVECIFKDDGKIKSVYAKRARGLMCRYLIQNRVDSIEDLKGFHTEGYSYSSSGSSQKKLVFIRSGAAQKAAMQKIKSTSAIERHTATSLSKLDCDSILIKRKKEKTIGQPLRRSLRKKRKIEDLE